MTEIMNDQTRLLQAVKDRKERENLSLPQIANAVGYSPSAISSFLSENYNGDNEKLAGKLQAWLDAQEAKERSRMMRPTIPGFIMTDTARTLINVMESAQFDVDLAVVAGNAGVGKTMAAKAYQARTNNVWMLTADPSLSSPSAVLQELAEMLGCNDKGQRRIRAIIRRLKDTEGLLIVDEAQHLSVRAIEELRSIHDLAEIGVVFMGNAPLNGKFDGMGRTPEFAQLFSRIGLRKNIRSPKQKDMCLLLNEWGVENDEARDAAKAVGKCSGGLRSMTKVLRNAVKIARVKGRDQVTKADLEAAWVEHMAGEFPKARVRAA